MMNAINTKESSLSALGSIAAVTLMPAALLALYLLSAALA